MATYSAVTAGEKDADSPINVSLIDKLDQNPLAIAEGASGAPKIQNAAFDDNSIAASRLVDDSVGNTQLEKNYYSGDFDSDAGGTTSNLPAGWSVTRNGAGNYTVTHNLGSTAYTIVATGQSDGTDNTKTGCCYQSKLSNSVRILTFYRSSGSVINTDVPVDLIIIMQ